jgi:hypothetical protein
MYEVRVVESLPVGHENCLMQGASQVVIQNHLVVSCGHHLLSDLYEIMLHI